MSSHWWRVGQGIDLLFILPVDAGQPLIVLPQMLFPRGDDEEFHKVVHCLTIALKSPLHRSGPQPGLSHPAHRLEEPLLVLWSDGVGRRHEHRSIPRVGLKHQVRLGPVYCQAAIHASRVEERPKTDGHYP
jgi:hypothetical protein